MAPPMFPVPTMPVRSRRISSSTVTILRNDCFTLTDLAGRQDGTRGAQVGPVRCDAKVQDRRGRVPCLVEPVIRLLGNEDARPGRYLDDSAMGIVKVDEPRSDPPE